MALETVQNIIDQAIADSGISIDQAYGKRWINEAMNKNATLYDTACVQKTAYINCTDYNTYYDLPNGCLRVIRVQDSENEDYPDYTASSTQIKFDDEDAYKITYLVEPKAVTTTTETPECHTLYNMSIAQYLVYRALKNKKKDEANDAYSEFLAMSKAVDTRLNRIKSKSRIPAPPYR